MHILRAITLLLVTAIALALSVPGRAAPPSRDAVPDINELGWKYLYWGMTQQEVREAVHAHGDTVGAATRPARLLLGFDPGWHPLEFLPDQPGAPPVDILALPSSLQDAELLIANDRFFGACMTKHTPQHVQDKLYNAMRRRYPRAESSMAGPGRYRFLHESPQRAIVWDARPTGFTLCFHDPRLLAVLRGAAPPEAVRQEPARTPAMVAPFHSDQSAPVQPLAGDLWAEPHTGMRFAYLPGGCFTTAKGERHCLEPFWMAVFETTNAQMRVFDPNHHSGAAPGSPLDSDIMPAVGLKPSQAKAFSAWLGRRNPGFVFGLPDQLQWEFAVRPPQDGENASFQAGWTPWDTPGEACRHANVANQDAGTGQAGFPCQDGFAAAAPVGMFQPNAWGLHDMLGNAWEWCEAGLEFRQGDGLESSDQDRTMPACGGGWESAPGQVHAGARLWPESMGADTPVGFRLVMRRVLSAAPMDSPSGARQAPLLPRRTPPGRSAVEEGW